MMNMNEEYKMCFSTKKQSKKKPVSEKGLGPTHLPTSPISCLLGGCFYSSRVLRCLDTPSPHPEGKQPVKGLP